MQEKGLTYKKAAAEIGISESMLGFILAGRYRITSSTAIKLGAWSCNEYPAHYWNAAQFTYDLDQAAEAMAASATQGAAQ